MKNKALGLVLLLSFTFNPNFAAADCVTYAQQFLPNSQKRIDGNQNAGGVFVIGALLTAYYVGILLPAIGLPIAGGAAIVGGQRFLRAGKFQRWQTKANRIVSLVSIAKDLQAPDEDYNKLKMNVQTKIPELTDDQLKSAILIANRDEKICSKKKAYSMKKLVKYFSRKKLYE